MHIPFSMSDEPDLGDELKYEPLSEVYHFNDQPKVRTYSQSDVDKIIRASIKMRDEAYQDGFKDGYDKGCYESCNMY